jgi:hypothetical protein
VTLSFTGRLPGCSAWVFRGFQHVIDGAAFERLDRVLVVGRDEHDGALVANVARRFHAGFAGHADVEEGQVRLQFVHHLHGFVAIFGLANDVQLGPYLVQAQAQLVAHQSFVVGNDSGRHGAFLVKGKSANYSMKPGFNQSLPWVVSFAWPRSLVDYFDT